MIHRPALPHERRATILLLAPALVGWGVPAKAMDEDTQLWLSLKAVVPLAGQSNATFDVSPRAREVGGDQLQTGVLVETPVSEWATPGIGAAYVQSETRKEWRAYQQITLSAGPVSFRTRVEERFFVGQQRAQIRLSERVSTGVPVSRRTRLTGAAEMFYVISPEDPRGEARIESWRTNVGVQQRLARNLTGSINYLMIYAPRENAPDRVSHIPQATLTYRVG